MSVKIGKDKIGKDKIEMGNIGIYSWQNGSEGNLEAEEKN